LSRQSSGAVRDLARLSSGLWDIIAEQMTSVRAGSERHCAATSASLLVAYALMGRGPTDCRSAAASALEEAFKKPTISRAKRSAATAGWAALVVVHGLIEFTA